MKGCLPHADTRQERAGITRGHMLAGILPYTSG